MRKQIKMNQVGEKMNQVTVMFCVNKRNPLLVLVLGILLCLMSLDIFAQGQNGKDTKDQTLKSSARVNPSTLAMEFSLPLGSYPGRNGMSLPVALSYSSKVWSADAVPLISTSPSGVQHLHQSLAEPQYSINEGKSAGWNSSVTPPILDDIPQIWTFNNVGMPTFDENPYHPNIDFILTQVPGRDTPCPTALRIANNDCYCRTISVSSGANVIQRTCYPTGGIPPNYAKGSDSILSPFAAIGIYDPQFLSSFAEYGSFLTLLNTSTISQVELDDDVNAIKSEATEKNGESENNIGFLNNSSKSATVASLSIIPRVILRNSDGSTIEFRKTDTPYSTPNNVDFSQIFNGTYYSVDGSNIRLEYSNQQGATKIIYYPDGSKMVWDGKYNYIDRHGNKISFEKKDDSLNNNIQWQDTLGNSISAIRGGGENIQVYSVKGLNNADINYQVIWKNLGDTGVMTDPEPLRYLAGFRYCSSADTLDGISPSLFPTASCSDQGIFNPKVLHKVILPNGTEYKFTYNVFGEVDKISYPTGAYERFEYGQINPVSQAINSRFSQVNRGVLKHWVSKDGSASSEIETNYSVGYANPDPTVLSNYDPSTNPYKVTSIASDGSKSERFLYAAPKLAPYRLDNVLTGMAYEQRGYGNNGFLKSRSLTDWTGDDPANIGHPTRNARVTRETSITFEEGSGSALAQSTTYLYDGYFNKIQTIVYDAVTLDATSAQSIGIGQIPLGNPLKTSQQSYVTDPNYINRGMVSMPLESVVRDGGPNGTIISRSQVSYDESAYPIINPGTAPGWVDPQTNLRGNATTARVWNSTTNTWIETHAQFDNFGNARKAWDAKGNVSEVEYSSVYQFAYPTKTKSVVPDPSGQNGSNVPFETTTVYDFYTGLVLSTTDANGQTASMEYNDPLLRPTKVIPPSGGAQTITEYGDTPGNLFVRSKTQIDATNWSESTAYFDGLGRTFKTQKKDTQGDVFTETIYDNMGRVKQVTNPFRVGETKQWSTTNYDAVGRVKEVIAPDGTKVESDYGISTIPNFVGTFVVGTDQAGKQGRSISNALGQLVRVDEPDDNGNLGTLASPTQPTFYNYSPQGQMVRVQQGVQNRFFLYDGLGRLIRVRQPEQDVNPNLNLTDPITGNNQWTAAFTYDISGNLITAKDAKNVTITSAYDNANRVLTRTYTDGTPQAFYKYDDPNIQFSKGKLTRSSNSVSTNQIVAFDNLGRVLASQQITDNNDPFTSSYLYNLSGALVEETYPSGRKVKNTFEADGDLAKIETQKAGFGWETRAQNFAYNSSGAISQIQIGNGLWETAQFNNRLQVTQLGLGTSPTDSSVWRLNYEFGELDANGNTNAAKNNGNIAKQTVTSAAGIFTQTYRYDSLERLKEAKETSGGNQVWIQNFAYDRYGNRIGQNQTVNGITSSGTPTVDINTNRFTTGQGYVYDFAGNIVQDNQGRQFTFNGDNKQVEVKNAQNVTIGQYFYDADGKRIKKITNTETTVFVYSSGKLVAEFTATNATPVAPSTQYFGTDMLESLRIITNQNAQIVSQRDFMPFGEDVPRTNYGTDNNRYKFTTYQKDNETGLDFAEARYYNNANGRFTAVDPLLASGKSGNPQTFNRYVYVGNSPTTIIDPLGLDWFKNGNRYEWSDDNKTFKDGSSIVGWDKVEFNKNGYHFYDGCVDADCSKTDSAVLYEKGGWKWTKDAEDGFVSPNSADSRIYDLGGGLIARVDQFSEFGESGFEIHVGKGDLKTGTLSDEYGIIKGRDGWVGKHGKAGSRPTGLSDEHIQKLNGINVDELSRRRQVPQKHDDPNAIRKKTNYLNEGSQMWGGVRGLRSVVIGIDIGRGVLYDMDVYYRARKNNRSFSTQLHEDLEEQGRFVNTMIGPLPNPCYGGCGAKLYE